jgi:D-threo-aldose 1-dehydrogenase
MDPFHRRRIGRTAFEVTQLGMGGASLGDMRETLPESQADATLEAAHAAGIGYFDTSPWYGHGKSELRFGHALRTKPRNSFALSTKVGRVYSRPADPATFQQRSWQGGLPFDLRFDYTRDGILRSYEQSLMRLGLNRVDALLIHDLDPRHQKSEAGVLASLEQLDTGRGFQALAELRARGEIAAIGAGVNEIGMIPRFLERFDLDFFLVAMPYTLLEQEALAELAICSERGVSVIIGAPFASGILARGRDAAVGPGAFYRYMPASPEIVAKAQRIQAICARHGVPLGAAALQFPLGHASVAAVIPGPVSTNEVRLNLDWMLCAIPDQLWTELKVERMLHPDAPVPKTGNKMG